MTNRRVRGGQGLFSWNNISDKVEMSYYLGHSEKTNPAWYTQPSKKPQDPKIQKQQIKEQEQAAMLAALGIKSQTKQLQPLNPIKDKQLIDQLTKRGSSQSQNLDIENTQGLGYSLRNIVPQTKNPPPIPLPLNQEVQKIQSKNPKIPNVKKNDPQNKKIHLKKHKKEHKNKKDKKSKSKKRKQKLPKDDLEKEKPKKHKNKNKKLTKKNNHKNEHKHNHKHKHKHHRKSREKETKKN
ncbi:multiple myeloma tumor-associated protein 2 family member [Anaeramoeba ignava]|uniref:Multiple myeloma tumor-associated protein 2 family member n=1 Tax=Anaeramoeba ignava TaxID=1746090 RepID=A0A9Q0LV30_ANAIG|nr:multiple myeloma tumor-associated protein 2 family member [Anaeramoeba ignava]